MGLKESAEFEIDPDGFDLGLPPIRVLCDSETGATIVHHDKETHQTLGGCQNGPDFRCDPIEIRYDGNVSIPQLKALIDISANCTQTVEFECESARLSQFGHWLDSGGDPQSYFHGSNYGRHLCKCHVDRNCRDSHLVRNYSEISLLRISIIR